MRGEDGGWGQNLEIEPLGLNFGRAVSNGSGGEDIGGVGWCAWGNSGARVVRLKKRQGTGVGAEILKLSCCGSVSGCRWVAGGGVGSCGS
jgi:hypothetical protein